MHLQWDDVAGETDPYARSLDTGIQHLFALLLVLLATSPSFRLASTSPSPRLFLGPASGSSRARPPLFVEPALSRPAAPSPPASASLPRFAYLISGSAGDAGMMRRCLLALYHPRNRYVLHLDAEAPDADRAGLAAFVAAHNARAGANAAGGGGGGAAPPSYTLALNAFADLTHEEFRAARLGRIASGKRAAVPLSALLRRDPDRARLDRSVVTALRGLQFLNQAAVTEGWPEVEKRFHRLAVDGFLLRSRFGQCIGE